MNESTKCSVEVKIVRRLRPAIAISKVVLCTRSAVADVAPPQRLSPKWHDGRLQIERFLSLQSSRHHLQATSTAPGIGASLAGAEGSTRGVANNLSAPRQPR